MGGQGEEGPSELHTTLLPRECVCRGGREASFLQALPPCRPWVPATLMCAQQCHLPRRTELGGSQEGTRLLDMGPWVPRVL